MDEDKCYAGTLELICISLTYKCGVRLWRCDEGNRVVELDTTQSGFGEGMNLVHMHNHSNCFSYNSTRPVNGVGLLP